MRRKTPLTPAIPLNRQKPLRSMSSKRAKQQRDRVKALKSIDADQQVCQRCGVERATDAHEVRTRARGGSITDLSNIRLLCRVCHDFLTRSPRQAEAEGFVIHSWDV